MLSIISSPSLPGACVAFIALFVLWYVVSAAATWYRLRHIPGPFLASFSHLWMVKTILRSSVVDDFRQLHSYGKLARNGPNTLVTGDPEILGWLSSARTRYLKDESYRAISLYPGQTNLVTTLDNHGHDKLKAMTASGYKSLRNPDIEIAIDAQIAQLIDVIRRKHLTTASDFRSLDFSILSRYFTLDVITRVSYGRAFGFMDADSDLYGYTRQVDRSMKLMALSQDIPFLRHIRFSPFVFSLLGPKVTDEGGVGKIMALTYEMVEEKFKDEKLKNDMMGSFIRQGMTKKQCRDEVMLQIIAGSDTTAAAIQCTLVYIMATPRVYSRLKSLIKQCLDRNEVSTPITFEQAQKLPYLQKVPPEGDTIAGIFVPGGTIIGYNNVGLTHDTEIFGDDVDVFRPERFLECSEEKRIEMEHAIDIVFGGGRWTCAGKQISFLELNKIFFEVSNTCRF
ncbi:hypothetical protein AAE478_006508 [Parahypoxylon ruwenzoriense]